MYLYSSYYSEMIIVWLWVKWSKDLWNKNANPNRNTAERHLNDYEDNNKTRQLISRKSLWLNFGTIKAFVLYMRLFFLLKVRQNLSQAQRNIKELKQLGGQQQFLTSIDWTLKVTADVLTPVLY